MEASKLWEDLKMASPAVILQIAGRCRFTDIFRALPKSPAGHSHVATQRRYSFSDPSESDPMLPAALIHPSANSRLTTSLNARM